MKQYLNISWKLQVGQKQDTEMQLQHCSYQSLSPYGQKHFFLISVNIIEHLNVSFKQIKTQYIFPLLFHNKINCVPVKHLDWINLPL